MPTTTADKTIYCGCMDQVKRRLSLIKLITDGGTTGDAGADSEFACLQLRKILEQIAYSALVASRDHYAAVRPQVEREWKATRILKTIESVHPDFYPKPVTAHAVRPGEWHMEPVPDGFLTKDDFVFLYDKCSDVIHDWNPYRPGPRVIKLGRPLVDWAGRINRLLSYHWIHLLGEDDLLLIQMAGPSDKAHVLTASPYDGSAA